MNIKLFFGYIFSNIILWEGFSMDISRINSILANKEKCDIFYEDRPVWIQGVNDNIAKVGFIDNFEEKDVFIQDLYERNLYN